jgi:hypothetical protein
MKIKIFEHIYSRRDNDSGWNVVQALTLLNESKKRQCASLIIYAALEIRMAIELLLFHIITSAKDGMTAAILRECKKKDGLFRVLDEVAPKYTLRCKFMTAVREIDSRIPEVAQWDIKILKKHFLSVSDLCHSQLIIKDIQQDPEMWTEKASGLLDIIKYLASNLSKGTALYKPDGANHNVRDLWHKYEQGSITLQDVRERLVIIQPMLSGKFKKERKELRME